MKWVMYRGKFNFVIFLFCFTLLSLCKWVSVIQQIEKCVNAFYTKRNGHFCRWDCAGFLKTCYLNLKKNVFYTKEYYIGIVISGVLLK